MIPGLETLMLVRQKFMLELRALILVPEDVIFVSQN